MSRGMPSMTALLGRLAIHDIIMLPDLPLRNCG